MKRMRKRAPGFSLLELMVVILLLTIIMGAVFKQIATVQQRSASEQTKLDLLQESREFMDQMVRDLHQAGYPNSRSFSPGMPAAGINDPTNAVGLVKIGPGDLWFEGDVNGDGTVDSVQYHYDSGANCSCNCPCVRRSEATKINAAPMSQGTASYQTEVQNVLNGTTSAPIFVAYQNDGTAVTSADFVSNPDVIAKIKTIQVTMTVQGNPDIQTGQRPVTTLSSLVTLINCSQASYGTTMSCQ